jgi:hypothetical protein
MATLETPQERIEARFQAFLNDPAVVRGMGILDLNAHNADFFEFKANGAGFASAYVQRRYMKALKARTGKLSPAVEKQIALRLQDGVSSYQAAVGGLERIVQRVDAAGLSESVNRHTPDVFAEFDYNPKMPGAIDEFRSMGVPEGAISFVYQGLGAIKFDVLRYQGLDGTIAGVVERAKTYVPLLTEDVRVIEQHGLPVLEGAGSQAGAWNDAAPFLILGGIVLLAYICH